MQPIKVILITFILFTFEALIHYNIGKNSRDNDDKFQIYIPTFKDFCKLAGTVLIFSILNGIILNYFK
jgi:hypothetical protein